jgi:hypothetical protein
MNEYDPFERVVLTRGIDNQILTSFRTLKRENNIVSDTFKVVHSNFQPLKNNNLYFKSLVKNQGDKMQLYSLSDNEDAYDLAQAKIIAGSLMEKFAESSVNNPKPSSTNIDGGIDSKL